MGILSTAADNGSIVLSQNGSSSGDHIGLDNVEFASATPEPGALALVGLGLLGIARKVRFQPGITQASARRYICPRNVSMAFSICRSCPAAKSAGVLSINTSGGTP
jgi:PEP-CTERM motif